MRRRTFLFGSASYLATIGCGVSGPALAAFDVSGMNSEEFLAFRLAVSNDYADGNLVVDKGWIVSATEYNHEAPQ